jgi:hypothetical protein
MSPRPINKIDTLHFLTQQRSPRTRPRCGPGLGISFSHLGWPRSPCIASCSIRSDNHPSIPSEQNLVTTSFSETLAHSLILSISSLRCNDGKGRSHHRWAAPPRAPRRRAWPRLRSLELAAPPRALSPMRTPTGWWMRHHQAAPWWYSTTCAHRRHASQWCRTEHVTAAARFY